MGSGFKVDAEFVGNMMLECIHSMVRLQSRRDIGIDVLNAETFIPPPGVHASHAPAIDGNVCAYIIRQQTAWVTARRPRVIPSTGTKQRTLVRVRVRAK